MNTMDALLAIAQISATFAGFTALMGLIRSDGEQSGAVLAGFRVRMMMVQAMITLFFCLLPAFLLQLYMSEQTIWMTANIVILIGILWRITTVGRQLRKLFRDSGITTNVTALTMNFSGQGLSILLILIALTHPDKLSPAAAYVFACLAMLFVAVLAFVNLARSLIPDSNEDA